MHNAKQDTLWDAEISTWPIFSILLTWKGVLMLGERYHEFYERFTWANPCPIHGSLYVSSKLNSLLWSSHRLLQRCTWTSRLALRCNETIPKYKKMNIAGALSACIKTITVEFGAYGLSKMTAISSPCPTLRQLFLSVLNYAKVSSRCAD